VIALSYDRAIVSSLRLVRDSPKTKRTNRKPIVSGTFLNWYRPVLVVAMVSVFAMVFLIIGLVAFGLGLILIYVRSK
jgi:hypothetical protein